METRRYERERPARHDILRVIRCLHVIVNQLIFSILMMHNCRIGQAGSQLKNHRSVCFKRMCKHKGENLFGNTMQSVQPSTSAAAGGASSKIRPRIPTAQEHLEFHETQEYPENFARIRVAHAKNRASLNRRPHHSAVPLTFKQLVSLSKKPVCSPSKNLRRPPRTSDPSSQRRCQRCNGVASRRSALLRSAHQTHHLPREVAPPYLPPQEEECYLSSSLLRPLRPRSSSGSLSSPPHIHPYLHVFLSALPLPPLLLSSSLARSAYSFFAHSLSPSLAP